jgi:hypothetical protein
VIGFDMGGTSTDVSRCGGRPRALQPACHAATCSRRPGLQSCRTALQVWRPPGARLRERDCGRDHPGTTARYQHGRSRWRLAPVL